MNPNSPIDKSIPRHRAGFILPFALTVTAVSAITAVMLISYFNNFSRYAHRAGAQTRCRLAAQSVIEQTKIAIQNRFAAEAPALMRADPMMVSTFCDWFATLSNSAATNLNVSAQGGLEEGGRTIKSPVKFDDCVVYVGILRNTAVTNAAEAILPIAATAELTLADKQRVSVTILEQVRFYAGQNQVFNYAYFANNYGWMEGSTTTSYSRYGGGSTSSDTFYINGDFRANGNVSIAGSTVNGFIYGAANPDIGAPNGTVTLDSAHYWGSSYYHNNAVDTMRPTDPIKEGGESWNGGYDAPSSGSSANNNNIKTGSSATRGATSNAQLVTQGTDPIEMPMISDLDGYVKYAKQQGGTLKCPSYDFTDSLGKRQTFSEHTVNAYYDGVGPSKNENLADKGALVLVGTDQKPIEINKAVVVDQDVIIKGVITGQGVIYAGRNIHIVGNVTYKKRPNWSQTNRGNESVADTTKNNSEKDLVCFIAKGNVVIGNCASPSWLDDISKFITPNDKTYNTSQHDCDPSDANIGYATHFDGNYTDKEAVGSRAKVRKGQETQNNGYYSTTIDVLKTENDRKYYETVCDDQLISSLSTTVTKLDGVFYNNHCVMGKMGDGNSKVTIFGSLVCRNEAISVKSNNDGMYFNWDNRLREGSPAHIAGLPLPRGLQTPHTYTWQEAPNDVNPIYARQSSALNER